VGIFWGRKGLRRTRWFVMMAIPSLDLMERGSLPG